jgi:hypothetical protein
MAHRAERHSMLILGSHHHCPTTSLLSYDMIRAKRPHDPRGAKERGTPWSHPRLTHPLRLASRSASMCSMRAPRVRPAWRFSARFMGRTIRKRSPPAALSRCRCCAAWRRASRSVRGRRSWTSAVGAPGPVSGWRVRLGRRWSGWISLAWRLPRRRSGPRSWAWPPRRGLKSGMAPRYALRRTRLTAR